MPNRTPAHIIVPSPNEVVLCWGLDADVQSFSEVAGKRVSERWTLLTETVTLGAVTSWELPLAKTLNELQRTHATS